MIKSLKPEHLLRKARLLHPAHFSTSTSTFQEQKLQSFRTTVEDPLKHTQEHLGQFYKIPRNEIKLFSHGGIPASYETQTKTFNETCLMVRRPAMDLINCLKNIDYSKPPVRFVIFGKKGTGKSLALAHILHYAHKDNFLLVHVPWVGNWMRRCKEMSASESREGFYDLNLDAAAWLVHFKSQNEHLLKNENFKVSKHVVWNKRETTPKDAPLIELVDQGINRLKYASECILHLAEEIKILSVSGVCKTLVAIDGFNAFFYPKTRIFKEKKEIVPPNKVTFTEAFLSLTKFDWKNAAIIVTVDELAIAAEDHKSHLPRFLLGKDGFEHLDPFVPIHVDNYDSKEFLSCMEYYRERKWVRSYPQQDDELSLLSVNNPYNLMQLTIAL